MEWHIYRDKDTFPQISISHMPSICHLIAKCSILLLMTLLHIVFLGKREHSSESFPCPLRRGHSGKEQGGRCVWQGSLSQPDSCPSPAQAPHPYLFSREPAPSATLLATKLISILHSQTELWISLVLSAKYQMEVEQILMQRTIT